MNNANGPIYGNAAFMEWCGEAFPEEGIADPDEGRCLWDIGYDILDIRAEAEVDHMGKIPNPQPGTVQEFIVMGPDKAREGEGGDTSIVRHSQHTRVRLKKPPEAALTLLLLFS